VPVDERDFATVAGVFTDDCLAEYGVARPRIRCRPRSGNPVARTAAGLRVLYDRGRSARQPELDVQLLL
jgi:hypothetical protein